MECAVQQLLTALLLVLPSASCSVSASSSLWGSRPSQPTCVDIPRNVSLCHGIGYQKMRLPNLLEHDSIIEVAQQAASWTPLLNIDCHPDTRLFLCSLFSPVCLDRAIYPCRSLCNEVRQGCEGIMKKFGFPWPSMFLCDNFPVDNDMCISPQAKGPSNECQVCSPVETYENILYNYCRADFVLRTKFRRIRNTTLFCKNMKILKGYSNFSEELKTYAITIQPPDTCCEKKSLNRKNVYLVMGISTKTKLSAIFILPWTKKSKPLKRAVRMTRKLNCSDPKLVSRSVIGDTLLNTGSTSILPNRRKGSTAK